MSKIRVASWNVQNLGPSKLQPGTDNANKIIDIILEYIVREKINVIGIMEIQGEQGLAIAKLLTIKLNNLLTRRTGSTWKYYVSSQQNYRPNEQYLYVWEETADELQIDLEALPAPSSLVSVIDENAFSWYSDDEDKIATLLKELHAAQYITKGVFFQAESRGDTKKTRYETKKYVVNGKKWSQIIKYNYNDMASSSHFQTLADDVKRKIFTALQHGDIVRFISYAARSPYLIHFKVGPTKQKLTLALYHAPGPQDPDRFPAINAIALSTTVQSAAKNGTLLVMGDFNITESHIGTKKNVINYDCQINGADEYLFAPVTPRSYCPLLEPISAMANTCDSLLGNQKTSLVDGYLATDADFASITNADYDKFLYLTNDKTHFSSITAKIDNIVTDITKPDLRPLDYPLAKQITAFGKGTCKAKITKDLTSYKERMESLEKQRKATLTGRQLNKAGKIRTKLEKLKTDIKNATEIQDQLNTITVPQDVATALMLYREAVSDHLPICAEITWK